MRNPLTSSTHPQSQTTYWGRIVYKNAFRVLAGLAMMALCISCPPPVTVGGGPDTTDVLIDTFPEQVHVAFAGGGWRAHTGHSAWTMSLLDNGGKSTKDSNKTLKDVFKNVGSISSNSGGSWFSTMLMYSEAFVDSIQAPNAIDSWSSLEGGWIGGQYELFKSTGCNKYYGDAFIPCVFADILLLESAEWIKVVEEIVFADFQINENVTLSDPTQSWATDKPLLLAATLLTDKVVLNESSHFWHPSKDENRFYQACCDPSKPVLKGLTGAYCSGGDSVQVTPATFSRIPPNQTTYKAPPFLSQNSGKAVFTVGYKQNSKKGVDTLDHITIKNPLSTSSVPVVIAAATSSAAAGFIASESFEGDEDLADREAISFSMTNSKVQYVDPSTVNYEDFNDLQSDKVVSLADGGPVDNSGVAQLVGFLQQNNTNSDTLHIVAFDNVTAPFSPGGTGAEVGIDIANLFGQGLAPGNRFCAEKDTACVIVPNLQIFDLASLTSTTAKWTYPGSNGEKLIYTAYESKTVTNPVFGVSQNTTVILHAFTCIYPTAYTVPANEKGAEDIGFEAYGNMVSFINSGLQGNKGVGLKHLQAAFGLKK